MIYKNEQKLLNIIKFAPPIFIITISIIITFFLYLEKQVSFTKEKLEIKNEYIKENKDTARNDVENLYKFIINTQEETEKKLKTNIKDRVYEAHSIAMRIYNENKNIKTKDEIKKLIQDALVSVYYDKSNKNSVISYARGRLGEVRPTLVPFGILLEIGYHDDYNDAFCSFPGMAQPDSG